MTTERDLRRAVGLYIVAMTRRAYGGTTDAEVRAAYEAMYDAAAVPSTAQTEPRRCEIRATHPYGFRSGEWATIVGVEWAKDRPCYAVRFPDGKVDSWVISDPSDPYEFRTAVAA